MAQTYVRTPASCSARGHVAAADAEVGNLQHCLVLNLAHGLKIVLPEVYLSAAVIIALMYVIKTL